MASEALVSILGPGKRKKTKERGEEKEEVKERNEKIM